MSGDILERNELDKIVEEIAGYSVNLVEDPTLPQYGSTYIQKNLSTCRNYSNRILFYLQKVSSSVRALKRDLTQSELDLEFKISEKLAQDGIVRRQASIADRKAYALSSYKIEYEKISDLKVKILDAEEILKIIKLKYTDIKQTSSDLRFQRQIIKDDKEVWSGGGTGYIKPGARQDRTVPGGMVKPAINVTDEPEDILNKDIKAEDMPEPLDDTHAKLIEEFLQEHPGKTNSSVVDLTENNSTGGTPPTEQVKSPDVNISNYYANLLED